MATNQDIESLGIFDRGPEAVAQALEAQKMGGYQRMGMMPAGGAQRMLAAQSGGMLGDLISPKANPQIEQAKKAQEVKAMLDSSGLDVNTPDYYVAAAKLLQQAGLTGPAVHAAQLARSMTQKEPKVQNDFLELMDARDKYEKEGNMARVKAIDDFLAKKKQGASGGTEGERARAVLQAGEDKLKRGEQLSPEEAAEVRSAAIYMRAQNTKQFPDPVKGGIVSSPYDMAGDYPSISQSMSGGGAAPPPTAGGPQTPATLTPIGPGRSAPRAVVASPGKDLHDQDKVRAEKLGSASFRIADTISQFSDEVASLGLTGDEPTARASVYLRKVFSKGSKTANFWTKYEDMIAEARKDRFGQSLTGNELKNFLRTVATPNMSVATIQEDLKTKIGTLINAFNRQRGALAAENKNVGSFDSMSGKDGFKQMIQGAYENKILTKEQAMDLGRKLLTGSIEEYK